MSLEKFFYQIISPERKFYHIPAYFVLKILSIFYYWICLFRKQAYRWGFFPTRKLNCRVISVGNLTLGGTGKTPFVIMIAETLRGNGKKPAILSRGYGGRSREEVNVVCDGKNILLSPEIAGDEPVMMAQRLLNVPILTGANRYQTGRYAIEHFDIDTIVLDDGFQHIALQRDLDILLFDHQRPFGNGNLFPAGELREPIKEARRADKICVTRYSGKGKTPGLDALLPGDLQPMKSSMRLDALIALENGDLLEVSAIRNKPIAAFCGIANPEDFRRILEESSTNIVHYHAFPDHHEYSRADLLDFEKEASSAGAEMIITTEKDAVKISTESLTLPVYKVFLELEILEGRENFHKDLLD